MRKVGLGLWVLAAIVGSASLAHASPQWRLVYVRDVGAELCPDEMELRMAVAARLGRDPFSSGASNAIIAHIARRAEQLSGSVELIDEAGISRGRRELSAGAATCDEMARAVALSVAIAIDPDRALSADAEESPLESREMAPGSFAVAPAPARPAPPHDRALAASLPPEKFSSVSMTALSIWGVAPGGAWGVALSYQRRYGWLAFGGGAVAATSPDDQVPTIGSLDVSLAAVRLEVCGARGVLELCALGLAGASWARAADVARPHTDVARLLAGGARLGVVVPVGAGVGILADGALLGVSSPVRAAVDGVEVWKAPALAVALGIGARLRFL